MFRVCAVFEKEDFFRLRNNWKLHLKKKIQVTDLQQVLINIVEKLIIFG